MRVDFEVTCIHVIINSCIQCHEQARGQPVWNQRSPHCDSDPLAALVLLTDAKLELEQHLMLAVADCMQSHGQAWEQPVWNQQPPH